MTVIKDQEGSATPSYIDNTTSGEKLLELYHTWFMPPKEMIGHQNRGGATLDYLGHANTTRALIEADPFWSWEPMSWEENGLPRFGTDKNGEPSSFWIWLTIHGKTLPAVGTVEARKNEKEKELIGDAIRNGAMRFGVALSLWVKEDEGKYSTTDEMSKTESGSGVATAATGSKTPPPDQATSLSVVPNDLTQDLKKLAKRGKDLGFDAKAVREIAGEVLSREIKKSTDIKTSEEIETVRGALNNNAIHPSTKSKEKE